MHGVEPRENLERKTGRQGRNEIVGGKFEGVGEEIRCNCTQLIPEYVFNLYRSFQMKKTLQRQNGPAPPFAHHTSPLPNDLSMSPHSEDGL